jgi:hypothetical protein
MVHALEEIGRVLTRQGTLIDLRPMADRWPVEVLSSRGRQEVGRVTDLPQGLADDQAANEAMRQGENAALFKRQLEETFPLYYTWNSPKEMQEYIEEEWMDFAGLDEDVWLRARSAWALADADARVGIRAKMLITRWIKTS